MNSADLKSLQEPIKEKYRTDPIVRDYYVESPGESRRRNFL